MTDELYWQSRRSPYGRRRERARRSRRDSGAPRVGSLTTAQAVKLAVSDKEKIT